MRGSCGAVILRLPAVYHDLSHLICTIESFSPMYHCYFCAYLLTHLHYIACRDLAGMWNTLLQPLQWKGLWALKHAYCLGLALCASGPQQWLDSCFKLSVAC